MLGCAEHDEDVVMNSMQEYADWLAEYREDDHEQE